MAVNALSTNGTIHVYTDRIVQTPIQAAAGEPVTIAAALYGKDGQPLDLSGRTVRCEAVVLGRRARSRTIDCEVTDAEGGEVLASLGAFDTAEAGHYALRFVVLNGDTVEYRLPYGRQGLPLHTGGPAADVLARVLEALAAAEATEEYAQEAQALYQTILDILEGLELDGLVVVTSDATLGGSGTPESPLRVLDSPRLGGQLPGWYRELSNAIGTLQQHRVRSPSHGLLPAELDALRAADAALGVRIDGLVVVDQQQQAQIDALFESGASALAVAVAQALLFAGTELAEDAYPDQWNNGIVDDSPGVIDHGDGTYTVPPGEHLGREWPEPPAGMQDGVSFVAAMRGANVGGLVLQLIDSSPGGVTSTGTNYGDAASQEAEGGVSILADAEPAVLGSSINFRIRNDGGDDMRVRPLLQWAPMPLISATATDEGPGGVMGFVDPDNPPADVVPNRLYLNSGNPNRLVYRTEAGVWREIESSVYTPFVVEAPVIASVNVTPAAPVAGEELEIEVVMDEAGGLPDAVSVRVSAEGDGRRIDLDVTYPDFTTLRAVATFEPETAGDLEILAEATNSAGTDSEEVVVVIGDGGDPGGAARYYGTSEADIFGLIDAGGAQDLADAAAAVEALDSVADADAEFEVAINHGQSAVRAYFAVLASLPGADSLEFSIDDGQNYDPFPQRTLDLDAGDGPEAYVVYRTNVAVEVMTYLARIA